MPIIKCSRVDISSYSEEGKCSCQFLDLIEPTDRKVKSVAAALKQIIRAKVTPTNRIFTSGADSAAPMTR